MIVVGVVGHTAFAEGAHARIAEQSRSVLQSVKAAAQGYLEWGQATRHRRRARLVAVSCLAPGADQVFLEAAAEEGFGVRVVLPAAAERYACRVRDADPSVQQACRDRFWRLLKRAGTSVVNLDRPLPEGDGAAEREARRRAYDAATRAMLHRCDVLVVIADLLHRADVGATAESVRAALAEGQPVVWIDAAAPHEVQWLSDLSEEEFTFFVRRPPPRFIPAARASRPHGHPAARAALAARVETILANKAQAVRFHSDLLPAQRSSLALAAAAVWGGLIERWVPTGRQEEAHAEAPPEDGFAVRVRTLLAHHLAGFGVLRDMARAVAQRVRSEGRSEGPAPRPAPPLCDPFRSEAGSAPADAEAVVGAVDEKFRYERHRAKELASFYAGAHRSSVFVVAALGVVAVALAVLPTLLPHHSHPAAEETGHRAVEESVSWPHVTAAAELAVIGLMLLLYLSNRARHWQEKSIDYRLLAERFRHAAPLMLVDADQPAIEGVPVQYADQNPRQTWIEPFFYKTVHRTADHVNRAWAERAPGSLIARGDADYLSACARYVSDVWIEGQIRYHLRSAAKYESINRLLETLQTVTLCATIGVCLLHFKIDLPLWGFLAAVFPAVGVACANIAGGAELTRLRDRSTAMSRSLGRIQAAVRELDVAANPGAFAHLVGTAAREMLAEVSEWRVLFKFRPMPSPG